MPRRTYYDAHIGEKIKADARARMNASINALVNEYAAWNKANGLSGPVDKHLFDENLTEAQRVWLRDFCERWNAAVKET